MQQLLGQEAELLFRGDCKFNFPASIKQEVPLILSKTYKVITFSALSLNL